MSWMRSNPILESANPDDIYHILVAHPITSAVLVTVDDELPAIVYPIRPGADLYDLCDFAEDKLQVDFTLSYLRPEAEYPTTNPVSFRQYLIIFEVLHTTHPLLPPTLKWLPKQQASTILVSPPAPSVSHFLRQYQEKALRVNQANLYPYSQPRWFDMASTWLTARLKDAGYTPTTINKHKQSSEGCISTATTVSGLRFYMKALPQTTLGDEVIVTWALGAIMPAFFPIPLALDVENAWLLMKDYGNTLNWGACNVRTNQAMMEKVLTDWAVIQKQSIPVAHRLASNGVPVFDREWLKRKASQMMNDPAWFVEERKRMSPDHALIYNDLDEYKQLYLAYIERTCRKADRFNVPMALVHGDMNAVNVIKTNNGCRFIDFAMTSISYPFSDALSFATSCGATTSQLEFYLQHWTEYESMNRLWQLLDVVNDIDNIFTVILFYHSYATAEECERQYTREEIGLPVCSHFNKHMDAEHPLAHASQCLPALPSLTASLPLHYPAVPQPTPSSSSQTYPYPNDRADFMP